jgi:anti-sigma-K factor RskA
MRAKRYDNPELIDRLAREYVLGTLHGRGRARFERELAASLMARRQVLVWETRLAPLARGIAPATPPPHVWKRIEAQLGFAARTPTRAGGLVWRGLAAAFAVIALALGALYVSRSPEIATADYVAVFTDADAGPVWLIQAFTEIRELRVGNVNPLPEPPNSSYELWMLPDDNTAPVSLGVIPGTTDAILMLTLAGITTLEGTSTLAVSVEPPGGSPTGAPTGPVILTAPLLRT